MPHLASSLVSLLSFRTSSLPMTIARRLGVRVRQQVQLRAMLCDYVYGFRPGSAASLLHGMSEEELDTVRRRLLRELTASIRDVAEDDGGRWSRALLRLANEINDCVTCGDNAHEPSELLEEWIAASKDAGATEMEFLRICA